MKVQLNTAISASLLVAGFALSAGFLHATEQQNTKKHVCTESNAQSLATPANACGSNANPCVVDVKRTGNSVSVAPTIQSGKSNPLFSVQVGTTVTWESTQKDTGFVIDFGPSSPFDRGAIIGGSDRSVSVVATKPGCYRYSAGACAAGAIYGMCNSADVELVVTPASK
jgi:plastocyanin